jgi:hypothetical protein
MDKRLNDIDLIERFLEGSLDEKELGVFNERVNKNIVFADSLAKRKLLEASYIEASTRYDLKRKIRSVIKKEKHKTEYVHRLWIAVASISLLVGIASFFILQSRFSSNNTFAKKENNQLKDEVAVGNQNKIEQYGSVDTFNNKTGNKGITYLPLDGTVFDEADTILFYLPEINVKEIIKIYDNGGSIRKKITIKPGSAGYKLLPNILEPGEYTWNHSFEESVTHSFRIK